ncbi:NUDIX hydrolase [Nonomuraea sp. NPDC049646]|uniref:NUDIX hydrolase n=1 Tax=unclassified Nonomuraea TaxID=2593643 RepID=UPI003794F300
MAETLRPESVELFDVRRLRLVEVEAPAPSPEQELARDCIWDESVKANPSLFDGPVVACADWAWEGPRGLFLSWARVTYRHHALRQVPGAVILPSLFVNVVQPADDGRVLVARMSSSTAAPGRWQLPGGAVEPPEHHEGLDEAAVRGHAARELAEETGVVLSPAELRLLVVTRGENKSIGLTFLAPPQPAAVLRQRFEAMTAAERALRRVPELDRIGLVRSPTELANLDGPHADYLEPVIRRYMEASRLSDVPDRM